MTVSSWRELADKIDELEVHKNSLVWFLRGQADANWSLRPSFLRIFGCKYPDVKAALEIEEIALHLFQSQAHLYLKPDIIDQNSWACIAWWSLMQHYSCPTRLLDWTRSPYVAAYFAVNQHSDIDGAIWLFAAPTLEKVMLKRYGPLEYDKNDEFSQTADRKAVYPVLGFQHTERSAAQQGVFTVSTYILADHGEEIGGVLSGQAQREQLTKIIIPASSKQDFLSRLHTMNITAKTLFPGMDGVGRSVSEIVGLRVWKHFHQLG